MCPYLESLDMVLPCGHFAFFPPSNNQNNNQLLNALVLCTVEGCVKYAIVIVSRNLFELRWEDSIYIHKSTVQDNEIIKTAFTVRKGDLVHFFSEL